MLWMYNRLKDKAREWAQENKHPKQELCIRVNGGKMMARSAVDKVAGNGVFGFPSRRGKKGGETVNITRGLYGQFKSGRKSIVRKRKNVCKLPTAKQVRKMQMDNHDKFQVFEKLAEILVEKHRKEKERKKNIRRKNRNPKARRDHR